MTFRKLPPLPQVLLRKFWQKIVFFSNPRPPNMTEWAPPQAGWLKLNFDGSSWGNPGLAGFGGLLRTSTGQVMKVYSGPAGSCTSNEAESRALLEGVRLLKDESRTPLVIEGDSALTIAWAKGTCPPPWHLKLLFDEIWDITLEWQVSWSKVPRSANSLADNLAKQGVRRAFTITGTSLPLP